jgi:hypothetical protein
MSIPDETLMAFADGELDAATRAEVEAALRDDPDLAKRVARHVALRQRVRVAYSSELTEPVPPRLLDAARRASAPGGNVVNLQDARNAKSRDTSDVETRAVSWRPAAAIAASVIVGFALGYANRFQGLSGGPLVRGSDGALTANGTLAKALSTQLTATQGAQSEVHIGVSFLAKSGEYCRTFFLRGAISPSGLACRHGEQWRVETLGQASDVADTGYRTAATNLSPEVLKSVEDRIDGDPLDAVGETQALQKNWRK